MPPEQRHETAVARGRRAECLAEDFLLKNGYAIAARNHRCQGGEVDLIAWHDGVLCFIEVRARSTDQFGHPLETIDRRKIARVAMAARHFLQTLSGPWPLMRFDALGIVLGDPPIFSLVQDAFEAPELH